MIAYYCLLSSNFEVLSLQYIPGCAFRPITRLLTMDIPLYRWRVPMLIIS